MHRPKTRSKPRLPSRVLYDIEPYIDDDRPLENVSLARFLVRHFIECLESRVQPDMCLIRYFAAALVRAEQSGKLAKELGLVRSRRGNPGISQARREKRRLSPDDQVEIAQRLRTLPKKRGELSKEVEAIAAQYQVSARQIWRIRQKSET